MVHEDGRFSRRAAAAWAAFLLAAACAGCNPKKPAEFHPVWPPPPAQPRVRHLQNIRGADDLAKPSFLSGLSRLILGKSNILLLRPHAVAVEEDKRLYVTDQERQAVMVFDLKGGKATMISRAGETFFVSPVGVAVCGETVAVSDSALGAVYLLTPKGKLAATLSKPGGFKRPTGLAYDAKRRRLYVVDTLANEICFFAMPSGRLAGRFGSRGVEHGKFNYPTHICLDAAGRIYVTDSLNFRVQAFTADGKYLFDIGKLGDASGHVAVPKGVAVDSDGHLYIVDSYFGTVQVFDRRGRFLLGVGEPGEQSGAFQVPAGVAIDSKNRIYVCDSHNRRIQLLQYLGEPKNDGPATSKK